MNFCPHLNLWDLGVGIFFDMCQNQVQARDWAGWYLILARVLIIGFR